MKKMITKFLVMFMFACGILTGCQSNSTTEGTSFVSTFTENLFEKEGYGDLTINIIQLNDGTESKDLAFGLNVEKAFPDEDGVDYTIDVTMNDEELNRLMYAFEFVYSKKLTEYGLSEDDTMSLYHAAQLVTWTIAEGWSTSDVKKAEDTIADAELNALADKIYSLYVDMYNYATNTENATFKSGTKMIDVTKDTFISDGTNYTLNNDSTVIRDSSGVTYYRSSLMNLSPNQPYGTVVSGDYAWTYTVELVDAPEGSRVVNEKGAEQYTFSTEDGLGTDFYIEIPTTLEDSGSFTVNVNTTVFYRLEPVYWSLSEYQSLIQPAVRSDSGTAIFTVEY